MAFGQETSPWPSEVIVVFEDQFSRMNIMLSFLAEICLV